MKSIFFILVILLFTSCSVKSSQTAHSLKSLNDFIYNGIEMGYIPKELLLGDYGPLRLQPIELKNRRLIHWPDKLKCSDSGKKIVLALDNKPYNINCDNGDVIYITGAGNDTIEDAIGNDIYYTGEGNDTIKNTWGSDIYIFEKNWGHDVIDFRGEYADEEQIVANDGSYRWKYRSFIVFGKRIHRSDIVWDDNILLNTKTGDTIQLSSRKINILFSSEEDTACKEISFIPEKKKTKLDFMTDINSFTMKGNIAYIANKNFKKGFEIVDFSNIKEPLLLSSMYRLPGLTTSVKLVNNIAYVTQAAPYFSEGAGGWVSMINVKDVTNPRLLSTVSFSSTIKHVNVTGKYMYVLDSNPSIHKMRFLVIYDISDTSQPRLVSKTKIPFYSNHCSYSNEFLFIGTSHGVEIYDVKNPQKPLRTKQKDPFKNAIVIDTKDGTRLINIEKKSLNILSINGRKSITTLCSIKKHAEISDTNLNNILVKDRLLFMPEYKRGIEVYALDSCQFIELIPFKKGRLERIGILGDKIITLGSSNEPIIYDISKYIENK